MIQTNLKCFKRGDGKILCPECNQRSVRNGRSKRGIQRYKCTSCSKRFQLEYQYQACQKGTNQWIVNLIKEGSGIRSISRLLQISPTTVLRRILEVSKTTKQPAISKGKSYELDELCTFVKSKESRIWMAYALERTTKEVVNFVVGKRTNKTLRQVTNTLILSEAKEVFTDKLKNYLSLIPKSIHYTKQYSINHIGRMNSTLRCHLKRLNRRTLAYSKSIVVLSACLRIYFWG